MEQAARDGSPSNPYFNFWKLYALYNVHNMFSKQSLLSRRAGNTTDLDDEVKEEAFYILTFIWHPYYSVNKHKHWIVEVHADHTQVYMNMFLLSWQKLPA